MQHERTDAIWIVRFGGGGGSNGQDGLDSLTFRVCTAPLQLRASRNTRTQRSQATHINKIHTTFRISEHYCQMFASWRMHLHIYTALPCSMLVLIVLILCTISINKRLSGDEVVFFSLSVHNIHLRKYGMDLYFILYPVSTFQI
jgi:hypothetical protein